MIPSVGEKTMNQTKIPFQEGSSKDLKIIASCYVHSLLLHSLAYICYLFAHLQQMLIRVPEDGVFTDSIIDMTDSREDPDVLLEFYGAHWIAADAGCLNVENCLLLNWFETNRISQKKRDDLLQILDIEGFDNDNLASNSTALSNKAKAAHRSYVNQELGGMEEDILIHGMSEQCHEHLVRYKLVEDHKPKVAYSLNLKAAVHELVRKITLDVLVEQDRVGKPSFNNEGVKIITSPLDAKACELLCEHVGDLAPVLDSPPLLLPIVLYSDKTQKRTIGQQSYYPIYMSSSCMPRDRMQCARSMVTVGFLPTFHTRTLKSKEKDLANKWIKRGISECWGKIADCLREITCSGLIVGRKQEDPRAKTYTVYPHLLYIVGDHPELQTLAGCSEGTNSTHPCRVCMVTADKLEFFFYHDPTKKSRYLPPDTESPPHRSLKDIADMKDRYFKRREDERRWKASGQKKRKRTDKTTEPVLEDLVKLGLSNFVAPSYNKDFLYAKVSTERESAFILPMNKHNCNWYFLSELMNK